MVGLDVYYTWRDRVLGRAHGARIALYLSCHSIKTLNSDLLVEGNNDNDGCNRPDDQAVVVHYLTSQLVLLVAPL